MTKGILSGTIVVDMTSNISGPCVTHVLSALGATVWKVERLVGGDEARQMQPATGDTSAYFSLLNSFKMSVALDLKNPLGAKILRRLLVKADVTDHPAFAPYGAFRAGDGGWLFIGVSNDRHFARLLNALGIGDVFRDRRFADNGARVRNRTQLRDILESALDAKGATAWDRLLSRHGVPVSMLQDADDVLSDP